MHTRLKVVLKERGISYEALAESTGLTKRTVHNAANGRTINRSTQRLIAEELKEDQSTLFTVVDIPKVISTTPAGPVTT